MPRCRYDLIAIDLDGTLLDSRGHISEASVAAIRRATEAGVRVSVCTGRGFNECKQYTRELGHVEPVVVAGGAILSDATSGKTMQRFPMHVSLVRRLVESLTSHGHAALVLKDPAVLDEGSRCPGGVCPGHDYLIVSPRGMAGVDPVSRWWFEEHGIGIHVVPHIDADEHPDHTVRVGVCGTRGATRAAAEQLRREFDAEATFHHFGAVAPGDAHRPGDEQVVILEAFDKSVNKWAAIRWLAARHGVGHDRIAAIGNDINDVPMLADAGLGVAVANAIPEALAVAKRRTESNDEDGVARAVERMLSGEW